MLPSEFTPEAPGTLVAIEDGCAFIPDALPPPLQPTWKLQAGVEQAGRAIGKLVGSASQHKNTGLFTRPLLTREAIESNRIEGTQTRVSDVLLQAAAGPPSDPRQAGFNLEVLRYIEALDEGEQWIAEEGRPLSLFLIRALHRRLLEGTRGNDRNPGALRQTNVVIGRPGDTPGIARFVPPPAEHVEAALEDLVRFIQGTSEYSPLISCALMHYQFEAIHPFEDGNGRLGRLLMPLYLMSVGQTDRPLLVLSPYFEARRDQYIELLHGVSTRGGWEDWICFFLEAVAHQAEDSVRRILTVEALQNRYRRIATEQVRTRAAVPAVDLIMDSVVVSIREVAQAADVSYNAAKATLDRLAATGVVTPIHGIFPQRWWARELISLVYEN